MSTFTINHEEKKEIPKYPTVLQIDSIFILM